MGRFKKNYELNLFILPKVSGRKFGNLSSINSQRKRRKTKDLKILTK